MPVWLDVIIGLFFIGGGIVSAMDVINKETEDMPRPVAVLFAVVCTGIGLAMCLPLILWITDFIPGSQWIQASLEQLEEKWAEEAIQQENPLSFYIRYGAVINVFMACYLFNILRKDVTGPRLEKWILIVVTGLVSCIVLSAEFDWWRTFMWPGGSFWNGVEASIASNRLVPYSVVWCFFWLIMIIVFRVHLAAPYGPVASILYPLPALIYIVALESGWPWYWMLLVSFGMLLIVMALSGLSKLENKRLEARRNRRTARLIDTVSSATSFRYMLYLRSFRSTGTLATQYTSNAPVDGLDLETVFAGALRPAVFIAFGSEDEAEVVGAGRIFESNENWWEKFQTVARYADQILINPGLHASILKEIDWLSQEGFLSKSLFIMPPSPEARGQVTVSIFKLSPGNSEASKVDHASAWAEVRIRLRDKSGIHLPAYDPRGALIRVGESGKAEHVEPLGINKAVFKVLRLRKAFNKAWAAELEVAGVA